MNKIEILKKLEILKSEGLVESAFINIKKWLDNEDYAEFFSELSNLIKEKKVDELNDAFYKVIPFGTGGRRGKMGVGTNRINSRTIAESAQGFADYLTEFFGVEEVKNKGIVITYDGRHNSKLFAEIVAGVFAANGILVYFFDGVRSTPQLSFTVRFKKAIGGVMISASHNPPSDNGIKVYWQTGGQVVPPHDTNIINKVNQVTNISKLDFLDGIKQGKIIIQDQQVDLAYHEAVANLSLGDYRNINIIFTPLHGCASTSFLPVLRQVGFNKIVEVKEQMPVDPDFIAVTNKIPNPEVPISMDLAIEYAKKYQADLVLAADPDADRIGVVSVDKLGSNEYVFLNGNQIAVLLFAYIISELKEKNKLLNNGVLVKTLVTTDLLTKIANNNGLNVIGDLPVGFKYIADAMENRLEGKHFIFGAEESHGYLFGDYARDKDGAVGALLISEYAAKLKKQGKSLFEQLEVIKKEYGYYRELLQSVFFTGMDGMDKMLKIMNVLRNDLPTMVGDLVVDSVLDQKNKDIIDPKDHKKIGQYIGFPDDALIFYLNKEKTIRVVVRPSGTEPKIKFYAAIGREVGLDKSDEEYLKIKKESDDLVFKVLEEFVKLAESISSGGIRFEILG